MKRKRIRGGVGMERLKRTVRSGEKCERQMKKTMSVQGRGTAN